MKKEVFNYNEDIAKQNKCDVKENNLSIITFILTIILCFIAFIVKNLSIELKIITITTISIIVITLVTLVALDTRYKKIAKVTTFYKENKNIIFLKPSIIINKKLSKHIKSVGNKNNMLNLINDPKSGYRFLTESYKINKIYHYKECKNKLIIKCDYENIVNKKEYNKKRIKIYKAYDNYEKLFELLKNLS